MRKPSILSWLISCLLCYYKFQLSMSPIELKFLFEGVIFSTPVQIYRNVEQKQGLKFIITFATKYLINRYANGYTLTMEDKKFSPLQVCTNKEGELVKSLQDAIINHPEIAQVIA